MERINGGTSVSESNKILRPLFTSDGLDEMEAFSDADWAGCNSTRRSTSGSLIRYGGGPLFWMSKRQGSTTLSTLESELFASCETAKACICLTRLLREAGYNVTPKLLVDNTACISLIRNPQITSRSKHIQVRNFFVREQVEAGEFTLEHCPTEHNAADLYTKIMDRGRFQKLRLLSGIVNGEAYHPSGGGASSR